MFLVIMYLCNPTLSKDYFYFTQLMVKLFCRNVYFNTVKYYTLYHRIKITVIS